MIRNQESAVCRGVHPPKANDAFLPISDVPLFSEYFRVWENVSYFSFLLFLFLFFFPFHLHFLCFAFVLFIFLLILSLLLFLLLLLLLVVLFLMQNLYFFILI